MKKNAMAVILSVWLLFMTGCSEMQTQPSSFQRTEELLGTYVTVTVYGDDTAMLRDAVDAAFAKAYAMEQCLSPTIADSELNQVNAAAYEHAVQVSDTLRYLTEQSCYYGALSGGALDCTIGEIIALWGIGTDTAHLPEPEEIQELLYHGEGQRLALEGDTVRFLDDGVMLQFGAVAKGYIADEMKLVLQSCGVESAALSLGGNVLTIGNKPDGSEWRIGITDPFSPDQVTACVSVSDLSVVTSGNYEKYFEEDGIRYHHILDPETGYPAQTGLVSVTILAESSLTCDALSTAVYVMGAQEGMTLIESLDGVEAVLITEDGSLLASSGMEQYGLTEVEE